MRRDELVAAAIAVISEEGLNRTTLAGIATRAGMSTALVNHYFAGKDELMLHTMRSLTMLWRNELLRRLPADPSGKDRLAAIIDGCFVPENFEKGVYDAWLQFWILALHEQPYLDLHRLMVARFWSNVRYAVREVAPAEEVERIASGFAAMLDGFAWRFAIDRERADFREAKRICWDYLRQRCAGLKA